MYKLFKLNCLIIGSTFIISCSELSNMKFDLNNAPGIIAASAQTDAADGITKNSAVLRGKVVPYHHNTDVSFVIGICDSLGAFVWGTSKNIKADPGQVSGDKPINVSAEIKGLSAGTTYGYYVIADQTYGRMEYFSTDHPEDQIFEGGIKFYIDSTGNHGLIAAPNDLSIDAEWSPGNPALIYAFGTVLGTGRENTSAIVSILGNGSYAAKLCDDYMLNGYNDWFLPSKDELKLMYTKRLIIGGFNPDASYWSSSENNYFNAWVQGPNYQMAISKVSKPIYVRAIRAF
jgi:hypothetical protein